MTQLTFNNQQLLFVSVPMDAEGFILWARQNCDYFDMDDDDEEDIFLMGDLVPVRP